MSEDAEVLKPILAKMPQYQATATMDLLTEFSRWKPGPAGRGGERTCRKRSLSPAVGMDDDSEAESSTGHSTPRAQYSALPRAQFGGSKRRAVVLADTQTHTHKRVSAVTMPNRPCESEGERSLLELLCMVATRVEAASPLRSSSSSASISSKDDASSPSDAGAETPDTPAPEPSASILQPHVTSKREVAELEVETPRSPSPAVQVKLEDKVHRDVKKEELRALGGSPFVRVHASVCTEIRPKSKSAKVCKVDESEGGHPATTDCESAESPAAPFDSANATNKKNSDNDSHTKGSYEDDEMNSDESDGPANDANETTNNDNNSHQGSDDDITADSNVPARTCANRTEVPAPFASLFKPETPSVVDEGMSRYPLPSSVAGSTNDMPKE
jgi:hypothetical protein